MIDLKKIPPRDFLPTRSVIPDSDKLLYGFLANFTRENTRKAYHRDLQQFFRFFRSKCSKLLLSEIDHEVITFYKNHQNIVDLLNEFDICIIHKI